MPTVYTNRASTSVIQKMTTHDPESRILKIGTAGDGAAHKGTDERGTSFVHAPKSTPAVTLIVTHQPVSEQVQDLTAEHRRQIRIDAQRTIIARIHAGHVRDQPVQP
jgi:hypothetical protein